MRGFGEAAQPPPPQPAPASCRRQACGVTAEGADLLPPPSRGRVGVGGLRYPFPETHDPIRMRSLLT